MRCYPFLFTLFCLIFSCTSKECQITSHKFTIPLKLTPEKDTFFVGDTISIISEFLNNVYDKTTDQNYLLDQFKFFPEARIRELSDSIANQGGFADFEVLIDSEYNFY